MTLLLLLVAMAGCVSPPGPAVAPKNAQAGFIYHCPGMGGVSHLDKNLVQSIQAGGFKCAWEIYNWLDDINGPEILKRVEINHQRAKQLAGQIARRAAAFPAERIIFTAHSAGNGVLVWTLEDLPSGVQVDTVVMLSPAVSPEYDLSEALKHVRGKAYVFYSDDDEAILGWGTTAFGTMDRQYTEAAGKVGFTMPPEADKEQYKKLVLIPYDPAWKKLGHTGNHVGNLNGEFIQDVLVPLILTGNLPRISE